MVLKNSQEKITRLVYHHLFQQVSTTGIKTLIQTVAIKIAQCVAPGCSAIIALGVGLHRLQRKEPLLAVAEITSAVASCCPWIGTTAAMTIDLSLIACDLSPADKFYYGFTAFINELSVKNFSSKVDQCSPETPSSDIDKSMIPLQKIQ